MKVLICIAIFGLMNVQIEAKRSSFHELLMSSKIADSCVGRCGQSETDPAMTCQCNPSCQTAGDCCSDFVSTCNTCATWGRCTAGNDPSWPCQCTAECADSNDCCPDYAYLCGGVGPTGTGTTIKTTTPSGGAGSCAGRCGQSGTDSTKPCQCNLSCQTYGDCCSDFNDICNSCQGRCSAAYNNKWPCQCNVDCPSYGNCCNDYSALCLAVTTTVKTTVSTTTIATTIPTTTISTTVPTTTILKTTTITPVTTTSTTTSSPESFTCPNDLFGKYPNPNDCKTFYECAAGQAHLMNCPPGLYYNPDLQVCDYLDNVPSCQ
ncbi:proteoglycan 4-like isoform X2 [Daphnia pulicaria]|uniref:proteoglycan 4-like isoform X2 n=1 Tax=Daphnia pulicaria TaxID=35523 RepID=UPI001EEAE90D|nr:proteoglycan 4-like isoform X2 [Daphnia pulicaria]XP_046644172.1 proteoglycan 4-like isoform X2 [Daphnia pulicaria]